MWTITFNRLRSHNPCVDKYMKFRYFLDSIDPDKEFPILRILDCPDLDILDLFWALRAVEGHDQETRMLAADAAERVLHFFEADHPDDAKPREAIEATRAYARGEITEEERIAAAWSAWNTWASMADSDAVGEAATRAAWSAGGKEDAAVAAWAALEAAAKAAWAAVEAAAKAAGTAVLIATGDYDEAELAAAAAAGDAGEAEEAAQAVERWQLGQLQRYMARG